ncbi:hypothetical protein CJ430_31355, partial [Klebsiella pneumoniae]
MAGKVYRIGSDIGLGSTVKLSISCWPGAHRRLPASRRCWTPVAGKVYRIGSDIGLGSTVKLSISCWPGAHRR